MVSRDTPRRTSVRLEDLTLLVRVPGRPEAIRAFTSDERADAEAYAAAVAGDLVPLQ